MTGARTLRRTAITAGLVGALLVAGLVVRAASSWAAVNAPLSVAPASIESLEGALAQERARSAALQGQLLELQTSSASLESALEAAQDRLGTDQETADGLRHDLAAAQARLAKVEAALRAAAPTTTTSTVSSRGARTQQDDEREEDRDDDSERDDD
jgi:chromosome segregation ATPase